MTVYKCEKNKHNTLHPFNYVAIAIYVPNDK